MEYYLYKVASMLFRVLKWVFLLLFLITLVGIIAPYFKDSLHFWYLRDILAWDSQIDAFVKTYVPSRLGRYDVSHWITLILALIAMSFSGSYRYEFDYKARLARLSKPEDKILEERLVQTKEGAQKVALLQQKREALKTSGRKEREQLLAEYVAIKKELESINRYLAFLAIDVVDSTGMKKSEDPNIVAHAFLEYRKLVESKLSAYGCIKSSWTPDGVMSCFSQLENAVDAAQSILNELPNFNRNVKATKADFSIRCGINAGYLLFDENLPLEQITDRVIDIAGHMQKYAEPNSIFIAKNVVNPVEKVERFRDADKTVDDLEVYVWNAGEKDKATDERTKTSE